MHLFEVNEKLSKVVETLSEADSSVRTMSDREAAGVAKDNQRFRGKYKAAGMRSGQKVKWRGKTWLVYDFDADSSATKSVTVALVSPDKKRIVQAVDISELGESLRRSNGIVEEKSPCVYINFNRNMENPKWQIIQNGSPIAEKKTSREILKSYKQLVGNGEPLFFDSRNDRFIKFSKVKGISESTYLREAKNWTLEEWLRYSEANEKGILCGENWYEFASRK